MHIGLIGGIGPAATDFYYRGLIDTLRSTGDILDATIVHADSTVMMNNLLKDDRAAQADIFLRLIERLKAAGAELCAVTSIGGHFCIEETLPRAALPMVNIIPTVNAELQRLGLNRVGLLGTKTAMAGAFYGGLTSVEVARLDETRQAKVAQAYSDMASAAKVTDDQRQIFFEAATCYARDYGVDATLLAGTDLFLAFQGTDTLKDFGVPVIDCAEIHIAELARRARQGLESLR